MGRKRITIINTNACSIIAEAAVLKNPFGMVLAQLTRAKSFQAFWFA
jgi:hypothetical protein